MTDGDDITGAEGEEPEADDAPAQRLRLSWGGATHQGQIRPVNQDALFADRGLFVVADGMGGHQAGEVASRITVKTLGGREHSTLDDLVVSASAANSAVFEHASSDEKFKGMGTTLVALAVIGDGRPPRLGLVNVGDSRMYRMRAEELEQVTDDHSYVAELVRRGQISETEAETHPYRNMLTRAIGVGENVEVDQWELEPEAGDIYLLCSDGLINEIEEDAITGILAGEPDPTEAAKSLITAANRAGGRDNITVVIVTVDVEEVAEPVAPAAIPVTNPMDTGVISSVPSTAPETAEIESLVGDVAAEAIADLEAIESDLANTTSVVDTEMLAAALQAEVGVDEETADHPISEPVPGSTLDEPIPSNDPLSAFDLPQLQGDDSTLPWLVDPSASAAIDEELSPSEDDDHDDAATIGLAAAGDLVASDLVASDPADPSPVAAENADLDEVDANVPASDGHVADDVADGLDATSQDDTSGQDDAPSSDETAHVGEDSPQSAASRETTKPINPFLDPVTASGPVDHFAPAVRGWKAPVAVTWRSLLFVTVVLAVIVAAGFLVAWYARSAYYVGYAGDEVVIYQGRPDGVLWFDPTLEETTGVFRQDLPASVALEVELLFETATLEGARAFVDQIRPAPGTERAPPDVVEEEPPADTTTTTLS